ncbi:MAG: glycoside hydrolase family 2 TIM barrel-domain containing protein [Sphingomonas sp.]
MALRMMTVLLLLLAVTGLPAKGTALQPAQSRGVLVLGADWRFARGDWPAAIASDFDDKAWTKVTLPHSFDAAEIGDGSYYRGPAWYRRAFDVAAIRMGRRLFVQFDAAATRADVYLNGRLVGRHDGGHAAFRFDVTGMLVPGRNMLSVRVDNSATKTITPLGGDFTLFGGLYRPVSLIETDDLHIDMMDHGGPGIYVRATNIRAEEATVSVDARLANDGDASRKVRVESRVLNAEGSEVARMSATVTVGPRATGVARLESRLASPRLWDGVRDPYLYRVITQIAGGGDAVSVPLGVRSFQIDPGKGLILNGRPYSVHGVNLQHSARPGKGTAVSRAEIAEDFSVIREMGSTGVRLVHFQHPQAAYEEADRLGLLTWTEIGINSEIADTPEFRANAAEQLRELIAQNFNHPSIFVWGIGNEVYADDPSVTRVLQSLQAVSRASDASRPTVYAHCCQADDHPKAMVSDVIGFNRYFGWYVDQSGQTIGRWAAGFHAAHPERAFSVSEYGAGGSIQHQADPPGAVDPASGWHPEQYQAEYHEQNWRDLADKPYIFATFIWVAFDFASAGRHEGDLRGINDKGLVTYDRMVRKDAYYWYQANWSDRPMIHITSHGFDLRNEPEVEVKAYTNGSAATLVLNGVTIGTATPKGRIVRWRVSLREGANRVEVRSADGASDAVEWRYQQLPTMVPKVR